MATKLTQDGLNTGITTIRCAGTGAAAISHYVEPDDTAVWRLNSVHLKLSAAPTTSENYTVTVDSGDGAAYDTIVYSADLSASSITSLILTTDDFGERLDIREDDKLLIEYTNTDTGTWGLTVILEAV